MRAANILGAFAKFPKLTIGFVMSVCPSVRIEHPGSHYTNFYEILYFSIFRKSVTNIENSLKSEKNSGYFMKTNMRA
jgi:hypothetical protein